MSYVSKVEQIYANEVLLTSKTGKNVNISCSTGEVLINGSDPSGGGASLPLIGTGNIEVVGDIEAEGNITAKSGGPNQGLLTAVTANIASDLTITGNGNLRLNGTGTIQLANTVSCGGIISSGDINTTANNDFVSARNIYFEGQDLYHREVSGFPPQVVDTPYYAFKQLPQLNADNTFTGSNKFNSNTTEFAAKVSVGTRDAGGLFTQNLALNTSGNIESKTINNNSTIQTGTVNCGNGGTNTCSARVFTTRTSGTAGWTIEQQTAQGNLLDNVLQIKGGQAGAYVTIVNSGFAGFVPNIVFDPQTEAEGGRIVTDTYTIGDSNPNMFSIKQPKTGADSANLIIQGSAVEGSIKFQNFAGTIDYVKIEPDSMELGANIPLRFQNYSFRPQQYSRNITLTIDGTKDTTNFTNMIFNPRQNTDWTNVNTGATNQSLYNATLVGYYKCTVTQTAISSASNYDGIKVIFDYVLAFSQQTSPDISPPISYGYTIKPSGGQPPQVDIDHTNNPVQSQPVFLLFPNQNAGETMAMTVKLTKMDF
jgi:hypothetical protein